jgi:hypothetical protein
MSGDRIAARTLDADRIKANDITADELSVGEIITQSAQIKNAIITNAKISQLDAGKVNTGTLNAVTINLNGVNLSGYLGIGGTNQPGYLYVTRGGGYSSSCYLRFEGGSKMWSDTSNRIGINSIGNPMYIYVDSTEIAVFYSDSQAIFDKGVSCRGAFNVGTTSATRYNVRFNGGDIFFRASDESGNDTQYMNSSNNDLRLYTDDKIEFYRQGHIRALIDNNLWLDGSGWADHWYESSTAFEGEPFEVLSTIKGEGKKQKENRLVKLNHKLVHPILKGIRIDADGNEIQGLDLGGLVKVQNEAILQLKARLEVLEAKI